MQIITYVKVVVQVFRELFNPDRGAEVILYLFIAMVILRLLEGLLFDVPKKGRIRHVKKQLKRTHPYTLNRLLKIVNKFSENDSYDDTYNFEGLYVVYNQTKKKYFVGADEHVMDGLMLHVIGEGYEDLYEDVEAGDQFDIRFLPIEDTQCEDLEALWYVAIQAFNSHSKRRGYN